MPENYISYTSEDRCLYCNELIPEGRMICPCCEKKLCSIKSPKKESKNSIFASLFKTLQL